MKKSYILSTFILIFLAFSSCCGSAPAFSASADAGSDTESKSVYDYSLDEMNIAYGGKSVYGRLYLPDGKQNPPLVILSHGFGGTYRNCKDYAISFAENGFASFAFDFCGGGRASKSSGKMTEMSVLTEATDLNAVLDYFKDYQGIDGKRIFLFGESQGGFVSTYVAANRAEDVAALVAFYPAYVLQDDSKKRNPNPETGSGTQNLMGITIGKIYDVDAQSFDIYDVMKNYAKKVLIVHGTADSIVPISYSERAEKTFPDANLIEISGANHGFYGSAKETATKYSLDFLEKEMKENSGSETQNSSLKMTIGGTEVQVAWEENESVEALKELAAENPLEIQMSMYGGFEQVGTIASGKSLPRNDKRTTTNAGDIVLYSGNQIVVFYGSNTWSYTRLGKIRDKSASEMRRLLSGGDVKITISVYHASDNR